MAPFSKLFFRKRHQRERNEILARLAASETISVISQAVEQSSASDKTKALARLELLTGISNQKVLGSLLGTLLQWMRDSPLNINLNARNFFATEVSEAKYMTKFEKMRNVGGPAIGPSGTPQGSTRDQAEQKMFGYERRGGIGPSMSAGLNAASSRIKAFGDMASGSFQGSIRPKYCTLNVWRVKDGSGAQWGGSFFVLNDHLKSTSSFVHADSFDFAGGDSMVSMETGTARIQPGNDSNVSATVATYLNMTRVIVYSSNAMLESIMDCAMGFIAPQQSFSVIQSKYNLSQTQYIEGHIHGELHFNRDIAALHVSSLEVNAAANPAQIRQNILAFSAEYNIPLTWL